MIWAQGRARVGPLPMPNTTMTKRRAGQHPAISGLSGGQRLDHLADLVPVTTGSIPPGASVAVAASLAVGGFGCDSRLARGSRFARTPQRRLAMILD